VRPGPSTVGREDDGPVPYVSQAPLAVRSAGGSGWDGVFPAGALAGRTLHAEKRDAFRLTVQVHRLRNISTTAAILAVVRSQSAPPSWLRALSMRWGRNSPKTVLRYESRTRSDPGSEFSDPLPRRRTRDGTKLTTTAFTWVYCSSTRRSRLEPIRWPQENRWLRSVEESHKVLPRSAVRSEVPFLLCHRSRNVW
jgi:hypothetical protein